MSRRFLAMNVLLGLLGALCAAGLIRELLTPLPLPPLPTPRAAAPAAVSVSAADAGRVGGWVRGRRVQESLQPEPVRGADQSRDRLGAQAPPARRRDGRPEEPGVPGGPDGQARLRLRGRRCGHGGRRAVHQRGPRGDRSARWAGGGAAAGLLPSRSWARPAAAAATPTPPTGPAPPGIPAPRVPAASVPPRANER